MERIITTGVCVHSVTKKEFKYELVVSNIKDSKPNTFYRIKYDDTELGMEGMSSTCTKAQFKKTFTVKSMIPYNNNESNTDSVIPKFKFDGYIKNGGSGKFSGGMMFAEIGEPTLEEARSFVKEKRVDGVECPCCRRFTKTYKRKMTKTMVYALSLVKRSGNKEFMHMPDFFKQQDCPSSTYGDFAKLRFWGLIDKMEVERADGSKRNGYYRINDKGIEFLESKIKVPSHVLIENDTPISFSDEYISVLQSSLEGFNYSELMKG